MPESYTVQLTLESKEEGGPEGRSLLREVATAVVDWATGGEGVGDEQYPWHDLEGEGEQWGRFAIRGEIGDISEWWELERSRPAPDGRPFDWWCEVRLATRGSDVEARIMVRARPQEGHIATAVPSVHRPAIVPSLTTRFRASAFGEPVPTGPRTLGPQHVSRFVEQRLSSPNRRLPLVLISAPDATGQSLVDPESVAGQVLGLAEVVTVSPAASDRLTKSVGQQRSCYGGAVRIYWPDFRPHGSPSGVHRFWPPATVRRLGPRPLMDELVCELAERVGDANSPIWEHVHEVIRKHGHDEAGQAAYWEKLYRQADRERARLREELTAARHTLGEHGQKIASLREENQRLLEDKDSLKEVMANQPPEDLRPNDILDEPMTIPEAVDRATREFHDTLLFQESAIESAERARSEKWPDLYGTLRALSEWAAVRTGDVNADKSHFRETPYDYVASLGKNVEQKRRNEYTFGGLYMPHHFRHASALRLYFTWEGKTCVVGHVGAHGPEA